MTTKYVLRETISRNLNINVFNVLLESNSLNEILEELNTNIIIHEDILKGKEISIVKR